MTFLGHVVSSEYIKVDIQKIGAVKKWPRPTNAINIKRFLNLVGYCRRFVEIFSSIVALLTRLTQKKVKFL